MAIYFPLFLSSSGYIKTTTAANVLDYRFFNVTGAANPYSSSLPDTFYVQTASLDVNNLGTTNQVEVINFPVQALKEKAYFLTRAIVGARTATAAQEPRVGLTVATATDGLSALEHPSSLTALQYRFYGSADTLAENTSATTNAAANTNYGDHIYAITQQSSPTTNMSNKVILVAGGGATVTADAGTTYMSNEFFGLSSSVTPSVSVLDPLTLSGSASTSRIKVIGAGDTLSESVLPPTSSLWQSQSLATALSTTDAVNYTTIFTLTGLVNGGRYLVNCYLAGRSPATATTIDFLVSNASNHIGTIWTPETATTYEFRNGADGTEIRSEAAATFAAANADRLIRMEYTFNKISASDPTIAFRSETAGTSVTIQAYSMVFYRRIDEYTNKVWEPPLTISSGSISLHTDRSTGNRLTIHSSSLPAYNLLNWRKLIKTNVTTVTGAASATAVNIGDLSITFANSRKYLVVCYLACAASDLNTGVRVGVSTANLTIAYTIESPLTTSTVSVAHNATPATATSPASNISNYYLYKIWALITTNAAGTPTFTPTLAADANNLTVAMGESLVYYVQF
jgi:hypothetical protein